MVSRKLLSTLLLGASGAVSAMSADEMRRADALYQANCAVCHSASRGGYVAPALHSGRLVQSEAALRGTIMTGIPDTLMPPFHSRMADADIRLVSQYIRTQPVGKPEWTMTQARDSLEVLADESQLPAKPTYKIDSVYDLMEIGRAHV